MIEYANRHDEKGIGVFSEMKSILSISEAKGKFVRRFRRGSQILSREGLDKLDIDLIPAPANEELKEGGIYGRFQYDRKAQWTGEICEKWQ